MMLISDKTQDALWRRQGRMMMKGALDQLFILLAFVLLAAAIDFVITPTDDCDASFWHRCQMRVLPDRKTGVQYLETRGGALIERAP